MIQKETSKAYIARHITVGITYSCPSKEDMTKMVLLAKNDELLLRQQTGFLDFFELTPMKEKADGVCYCAFGLSIDSFDNLTRVKKLSLSGDFCHKMIVDVSNEQMDAVTMEYVKGYVERMNKQAREIMGTDVETKVLSVCTEELSKPSITIDVNNIKDIADIPEYVYNITVVVESKEKK